MNQIEKGKNKKEIEGKYRRLITELKILYMRAQYNREEIKTERYKNAYKKLELIQDRRHLTQIGEKGKDKEAYVTALKIVEKTYEENDKTKETLEDTIDAIGELCVAFDIKYQVEKNGELSESEFER